jgi:hypothetical protein
MPRDSRGLTKRSAIARLVRLDSGGSSDATMSPATSAAFDDLLGDGPSLPSQNWSILERLVSVVLARGFGMPSPSASQPGDCRGQATGAAAAAAAAASADSGVPSGQRHPSLNFGFGSDGESVDINGFSVGQTSNGLSQFSVFSLADLNRESAVLLGQGAGGRVLRMQHQLTGEYYAVKEIVVGSAQTINEIKKEISVLWGTNRNHDDLPSPFLIMCHGIFYEQGMLYIVMDLMACSLKDALDAHGAFDEVHLRAMFFQVLHGLHYLHHTKKQLHRDIKPHNILISDMGSVKISDFGIASERVQTLHHNARQTFCGTLSYMSPGRAEGLPYSFEADIWGVGMSLYQLAVGELPDGSRSVFAIAEFRQRPPRLPADDPKRFSREFQDFVAMCLQPEARNVTVRDLLCAPWMRGMTLERSQRCCAEVARTIVAILEEHRSQDRRDSELGLGQSVNGVDALAALDEACAETTI